MSDSERIRLAPIRAPENGEHADETNIDDISLLGNGETKYRCTIASLKRLLRRVKWRLLFIVFVSVFLLTATFLFSMQDTVEESNTNYAVSFAYPLTIPLDPHEPVAAVEAYLSVSSASAPNVLGRNLTIVLMATVGGVEAMVGDEWSVVISGELALEGDSNHFAGPEPFDPEHDTLSLMTYISPPANGTGDNPVVVTLHYIQLGKAAKYQVVVAAVILITVYIVIVFELLHRTIAAMLGSFVTLAALSALHERPSLETIIGWIEYETVCLLFGMMIMVGIFSTTGFFEWCAIKAFKFSGGDQMKLVTLLCMFTAFVSAFLDNVTTVLLVTPVTIELCKVIRVDPKPILIAEVLFSNIGGTATAIGDPPNVIIVSDGSMAANNIKFLNFTLHLFPGALLCIGTAYVYVRWRQKKKHNLTVPKKPTDGLEKEIELWEKALRNLHETTEEEKNVAKMLRAHILSLQETLRNTAAPAAVPEEPIPDIKTLEAQYPIRNINLFISCSILLFVVIFLFFLQSVVRVGLNLAWISILGAMCLLLVSGIHDIEEALEKVEWGTLLFFGSLFVLMEGLDELGLVDYIGDATANLIKSVHHDSRLAVAIVILCWVSAIVSAFIDNIPYITAMIPVVLKLGTDPEVNLPLQPLVWALAFGTCLGGNGTLIGASANVVTAGLAEQQGHHISFVSFFKLGFPVMLVTNTTAMIYLLLCHCVFEWGNV